MGEDGRAVALDMLVERIPGPGLFLLVVVLGLGLLLLLDGWLRLLGYGRRLDNCRFLFFREPQPALRHVENDGAIPFKGDFARKV